MAATDRATAAEHSRAELAQLVRWMLDSGMYDTEDVVDAILRPGRFQEELYAAMHGVDQEAFDAARTLCELTVGPKAVLPDGWTAVQTSVLDTTVLCPHGRAVIDTVADRAGSEVDEICASGCSALGSGLIDQPSGGALIAFRPSPRRGDRRPRPTSQSRTVTRIPGSPGTPPADPMSGR